MVYAHDAWVIKGIVMSRLCARSKQVPAPRRPTNVTLPEQLLNDARELQINLSQAAERGVAAEVKAEKERRWLEENRAAIDSYNERIERDGLLLEQYRTF